MVVKLGDKVGVMGKGEVLASHAWEWYYGIIVGVQRRDWERGAGNISN